MPASEFFMKTLSLTPKPVKWPLIKVPSMQGGSLIRPFEAVTGYIDRLLNSCRREKATGACKRGGRKEKKE